MDLKGRSLKVNIEELVVEDLNPNQARRFEEALNNEVRRLFSEPFLNTPARPPRDPVRKAALHTATQIVSRVQAQFYGKINE